MSARVSLVFALLIAGCAEERRYVGDGVSTVAITEDTAPVVESDEGAIYIVERRIDLPVRQPAPMVLDDLVQGAAGFEGLPFPRLPWVERGQLEVQLDFVLTNLDDEEHDIGVIVNGYNEFHEYVPGVIEIEEEPLPEFSQWERFYTLAAGARLTGTVREDELDEVAVDLATVVNGAPSSSEVVFFANQSSEDSRTQQYIPEVIPGLVGVRVGLLTLEPVIALLEVTLRVRDTADRLPDDDDALLVPMPEEFMPVSVEEE
jgi:hypothetical protein